MSDYLSNCLSAIESDLPNCGIILTGDFNHFNSSSVERNFKLKQVVKFPTCGNKKLDKILTTLHTFYDKTSRFPPFGLTESLR
jgi:hypothetical protein